MIDLIYTTVPATAKRNEIRYVSGFTRRIPEIAPAALVDLNRAAAVPGRVGALARKELAAIGRRKPVTVKGRGFLLALQSLHPTVTLDRAERGYLLREMGILARESGLSLEELAKLAA